MIKQKVYQIFFTLIKLIKAYYLTSDTKKTFNLLKNAFI